MEKKFNGTQKQFHALEYSGYWNIQDGQYYGDNNVLDAEHVGEYEAEQNAKLFAASKDLLTALQNTLAGLIAFIGDEERANEWPEVQQAKEAINKALD